MYALTKDKVAQQLKLYLDNTLRLDELVDWAENIMMDGKFDPNHHDIIRDVVARLGVADVREFGLTWHDCEQMLNQLGYQAHIDVVKR